LKLGRPIEIGEVSRARVGQQSLVRFFGNVLAFRLLAGFPVFADCAAASKGTVHMAPKIILTGLLLLVFLVFAAFWDGASLSSLSIPIIVPVLILLLA